MKTTATILAALLLGAGGFALTGCNGGKNGPSSKTTGLNEKPPQPTTGGKGTKAPTPSRTTATTTG